MRQRILILVSFAILIAISIIFLPNGSSPNIVGNNYNNVSVWTHVNITNSFPEVLNITIYDTFNSSINNITINAGSYKSITCNATVRDWDGFNDIKTVNATLYHYSVNSSSPDDNNTHYTNSSCTLNASTGTYTGWYACNFQVLYYADNGTWTCNATAIDSYNTTGSLTNTTYFYPVYALNLTDGIDYGNVPVAGFSNDTNANITNFGNMPINISVEGYANSIGDGLAMNCSIFGNITVNNERFATSNGITYGSKNILSSSLQLIPGLTMPKQNTSVQVINQTFWQLYIPPNPAGNCTGWVLFTAQAP